MTLMPQTERQKIRSRLRSYERKLQQEKKEYGYYNDSADKRYLTLDPQSSKAYEETLIRANDKVTI